MARSCTACSLTCCAWFAGLTSLRARRCRVHVRSAEGLSVDTSLRRAVRCGLGAHPTEAAREQRSALLLLCRGDCRVGHVPHGQWALLDADMLVLIDRPACLAEPCTCACHTKCAPHGPLTVSVARLHREVFAPHSPLAPALSLRLRDLDLLLDVCFSFCTVSRRFRMTCCCILS